MCRSILALCCIIGLTIGAQPEAPHHSTDHLPNTAFSCRDKVLGGYYADPDAQCQMFHVCVKVAGVGIQDFRFLCPNGTAFDQEAQICAGWADVACDTTALYYSSDNFDLYRIGSGFESKKAPHISEEEQDFHLQRAEPDILSGAHSSNFFNNREGKDIDDPRPSVQNRNQVDNQQKRKVVKKLQRRPVDATTAFTTTTQRIHTSTFPSSYSTTTSRPLISSTYVSSQAPSYSGASDVQKTSFYHSTQQNYEQTKTTSAPIETKKAENVNFNDNRSFRQRTSTPSVDYSQTAGNTGESNYNSYKNERSRQQSRRPSKQYSDNYSSPKSNQEPDRSFQSRSRGQQTYQNIRTTQKPSSESYNQQNLQQSSGNGQYKNNNQQTSNQQTYTPQNLQSTQTYNNNNNNNEYQKINKQTAHQNNNNQQFNNQQTYTQQNQYSTQAYSNNNKNEYQQTSKQAVPQTNLNSQYKNNNQQVNNQQSYTQQNQYSTPAYNNNKNDYHQTSKPAVPQANNQYNNINNQASNQQPYNQQNQYSTQSYTNNFNKETSNKVKYNSQSSTQTTPQYSQQDENKQNTQKYSENFETFDKKPTGQFNEKKTQQIPNKQAGFENYNKNSGVNLQQTPPPKFNTNLLYDNNQQSTPDYYSSQPTQGNKNNFNQVQNQKQASASSSRATEINNFSGKSTSFNQQPTVQPFTYNPGKNNYHNQPSYDKSKLQQQYSTIKPTTTTSYNQVRSSTFSYKNSEYDDGQYRPEFYEREAGGEYDVTAKQVVNQRVFEDKKDAPEQEFLKTAHSINIAASGNKLHRENQRLNAAQNTPPRQQNNYVSRDNVNRRTNEPSTVTPNAKKTENTYLNYQPSTTLVPSKPQTNDAHQNNYFVQSSTVSSYRPQFETQSYTQSQAPSSTPAPFNNQQYNARNNQRQNNYTPSSTDASVRQYSENRDYQKINRQNNFDVSTQQQPRTQYTTASPRSVYSSFAAVTSEAPRPFSLRTEPPVVSVQPKKQVVSKTSASSLAKPVDLKKAKDASYDYAYYDTSDHYSDYENIEEFRRTSKKH